MHLIEQYALACGVKIDKPHIETGFYPVPVEKYITLHASSGMHAKNYDYYNDVVELLIPYLNKEKIYIIQIGQSEDQKINNCIHYTGTTNLKQVSYLIQNSVLHMGNDSFSAHVASGFNKKIVSLYSVLYKECCGPYWGDTENHVLLEPNTPNRKPSFSDKENPKAVNKIKPEDIARGVLDLLGIPHNLGGLDTIHIGLQYHLPSIAVIPNHVMPDNFMPGRPINILANEFLDEKNIIQWSRGRKINIFTDKPISPQCLRAIRPSINQINFEASMDTDENYLANLSKSGIPTQVFCKHKDIVSDVRLKLFDWNVDLIEKKTKKDLDNSEKICDNTKYKNSRIILSGGKTYNSKASWQRGIEATGEEKIIDCPEFWEEIDTLKVYNEEK